VPRHMRHMTLIEIADVREQCPEIADGMRAILAHHQLRACTFPLARLVVKPGIAFLEPRGRRTELNALRSGLNNVLVDAGVPALRSRTFNPHVTLGRGRFNEVRRRIDPIFWHADRIALVESWRGETHHAILETWPLLPPIQGAFDFAEAA
jgi:2'-5' RNA ligase